MNWRVVGQDTGAAVVYQPDVDLQLTKNKSIYCLIVAWPASRKKFKYHLHVGYQHIDYSTKKKKKRVGTTNVIKFRRAFKTLKEAEKIGAQAIAMIKKEK